MDKKVLTFCKHHSVIKNGKSRSDIKELLQENGPFYRDKYRWTLFKVVYTLSVTSVISIFFHSKQTDINVLLRRADSGDFVQLLTCFFFLFEKARSFQRLAKSNHTPVSFQIYMAELPTSIKYFNSWAVQMVSYCSISDADASTMLRKRKNKRVGGVQTRRLEESEYLA